MFFLHKFNTHLEVLDITVFVLFYRFYSYLCICVLFNTLLYIWNPIVPIHCYTIGTLLYLTDYLFCVVFICKSNYVLGIISYTTSCKDHFILFCVFYIRCVYNFIWLRKINDGYKSSIK